MKSYNLLVAALVLVALSGLVWWVKKNPLTADTNTPVNPKLLDIPTAQIQSIDIQKKDSPKLVLQYQNGKWSITSPTPFSADQDAASGVASSFSPVSADNVVDDKPSDLATYGLKEPLVTITVHEKSGKADKLMLGGDIPASALVYARVGSDPKVYAVSSSVKTSLAKDVNDLRDKRLLTADSSQVSRVELISPKSDLEFGKVNQNEWQIVKPEAYRADSFQVEELLRKLSDAKMDLTGTAADAAKNAGLFSGGQLVATAKLTDAGGTQSLEIRKNKDDYYGKSSAVPGIYKVASDLGKEAEKTMDDFRNKKIFDFGFNDPTKLQVQQGSSDKTYVRSGTDWKMANTVMDAGSIQGLIDKLRDVAASKFVTSGFTTPALVITVVSSAGKRTERAEFSETNSGYIARREGQPALYELDMKSVNDILEAANAIKPTASGAKK